MFAVTWLGAHLDLLLYSPSGEEVEHRCGLDEGKYPRK